MTIGERLKKWRKDNGYTTLDIAAKTGLSTGGLSEYENNKKLIGSKTLLALYEAYNLDINWILTGESENNMITDEEFQILQYYRLCDVNTKEQILNFILFNLSSQNNASTDEGKSSSYKTGS
jgi:transcriptional regulator with XRE-family HTH domain